MLLRFDTITRVADFDDRAASMQLRPWQWKFLLAADGRVRLEDLVRTTGIDYDCATDLVRETEALGLVEIVTQTLERYRESTAEPMQAPAPPLSFAASSIAAAPIAAPSEAPRATSLKRVSVSFDALSSIFGEARATLPIAASLPPMVETAPAQLQRHDEPHAANVAQQHAAIEPDSLETPAQYEPLGEGTAAADPTIAGVDARAETPHKSVSFSLFASTFGAVTLPYPHDIATNGEVADLVSRNGSSRNGSSRNGSSHDGSSHDGSLHDGSSHDDLAVSEMHDVATHDHPDENAFEEARRSDVVDLHEHPATQEFIEPAPEPARLLEHGISETGHAQNSESLAHEQRAIPSSLSHDVDVMQNAHAEDVVTYVAAGDESSKVSEQEPNASHDILLQHLKVASADSRGLGNGVEHGMARPNGDLTSSLLRALGLKK